MSDPRQGQSMGRNIGRSLELYFVDGVPDGLVTAEMFNWTGHVLMVPRTRLVEALRRREAGYTGVYLLMGEAEGGATLYIGETERLASRLKQHAADKDWWDRAVLVTARDDGLNKAHVRYLESRLCETAVSLGRPLENGNTPGGAGLSEAQAANMEGFLEELRVVLPALGVTVFKDGSRSIVGGRFETIGNEPAQTVMSDTSPIFELTNQKHGLRAIANQVGGEFVVLKGSQARVDWGPSLSQKNVRAHQELSRSGVLVVDETTGSRRFTRDYSFSSPGAAGSIVSGIEINGRIAWRVEGTGQTYKDWEAERLAQVEEPA